MVEGIRGHDYSKPYSAMVAYLDGDGPGDVHGRPAPPPSRRACSPPSGPGCCAWRPRRRPARTPTSCRPSTRRRPARPSATDRCSRSSRPSCSRPIRRRHGRSPAATRRSTRAAELHEQPAALRLRATRTSTNAGSDRLVDADRGVGRPGRGRRPRPGAPRRRRRPRLHPGHRRRRGAQRRGVARARVRPDGLSRSPGAVQAARRVGRRTRTRGRSRCQRNGRHSPGRCAKRSAITTSAMGLWPSPQWLP